jgi:hypothetical protein
LYDAFFIKGYAGVAQVVFQDVMVIVGAAGGKCDAAFVGKDVLELAVFVNKVANVVGGVLGHAFFQSVLGQPGAGGAIQVFYVVEAVHVYFYLLGQI